jgi:hypothetical protein
VKFVRVWNKDIQTSAKVTALQSQFVEVCTNFIKKNHQQKKLKQYVVSFTLKVRFDFKVPFLTLK